MHTPSQRYRLFVAAAIALCGGVLAWRAFERSRPGEVRADAPGLAAAADTESLHAAEFRAPAGEADVRRIVRTALQAAARTAPEMPPARRDALLELAGERLAIYLNPSFDAYDKHVRRLTGRSVREAPSGAEPLSVPENWTKRASRLAMAPTAPALAAIRTHRGVDRGIPPWMQGGRIATMKDPGVYSGLSAAPDGAQMCDVLVPIIVGDVLDSNRSYRAFLVQTFFWDANRARWVPLRAGVYEPPGGSGVILAPWL